jgi:phosphoglycolate phosphatase-like HAD superfamily hydrolase
LRINGVEEREGLYEQFAEEQAQSYAGHFDDLIDHGRALPGAVEAVRALAVRADVLQSVLTGNTKPSAEVKLLAFGLYEYIDMEIGAYGTDDDTRANLVNIARQRAEKAYGADFSADATVLLGDTPNDVAAAQASGARIIAVATGTNSATALAEAGAPIVLADLTNTPAVLDAIYGQAG